MKHKLRFTTDTSAIAALHMRSLSGKGKSYSAEEIVARWQTVANSHFITAEGAGFLALQGRGGKSCYISDVYVDPTARNLGIGRALIQAVKGRYSLIELHVDPQNTVARSLYASEGFVEIPRDRPESGDRIRMKYAAHD